MVLFNIGSSYFGFSQCPVLLNDNECAIFLEKLIDNGVGKVAGLQMEPTSGPMTCPYP